MIIDGYNMVQFPWSERIELTEANVRVIPERRSGIYRLMTRRQRSEEYPVIYVGKSRDLRERLLEHLSDGEENACLKEKISTLMVWYRIAYAEFEEDRQDAEHTMYHKFNPSCNEVEPAVNVIDMNFS